MNGEAVSKRPLGPNVNQDLESCDTNLVTRDIQFDDKRSFIEELDQHKSSIVWAFDYGEEVAKKTEENIHVNQKKALTKITDKSPINPIEPQPSISHRKTPSYEAVPKKSRSSENGEAWTAQRSRESPLPIFPWANSAEVWQTMVYKEEATSRTRNCRLFEDPCSLLPRMRAILIDWIMEVCEAYHLTRVTYYLAVDYIDRFLTIKPTVPKDRLQLIGISALFIAAKLEEVYPPKLSEFSYICDGVCNNEDILNCEILLLNILGWEVNPMTPTGWLNLYMQIYFDTKPMEIPNCDFFYPQYSPYQFVRASHLIDLFSLDPGFLRFRYSIIAAGGMYFLFGKTVAMNVSGLEWSELKDCTEYMAVFYSSIRDANDPRLQIMVVPESNGKQDSTVSITFNEHHFVQTHVIDLKYFEKSTLLRLQRMGLHVHKIIMSKKNQFDSNENSLADSSIEELRETSLECEKQPFHVIFEIEHVVNTDDKNKPIVDCLRENDAVFFTSKPAYTFDEILVGINECTNKILLPRLGHSVQTYNTKNFEK